MLSAFNNIPDFAAAAKPWDNALSASCAARVARHGAHRGQMVATTIQANATNPPSARRHLR